MKQKLLYVILMIMPLLLSAQTVGIVGPAANGWPDGSNPTPDIMLTDNGDGTHSIAALTLTTGAAKFRENQDWAVNYGGDTFPSGPITSGDIPVQAGIYDIVLDLNANTYTFTDVSTFPEIQLVGSSNTGSVPMMNTTDGESYELSVTEFSSGTLVFEEVGTSNTYGTDAFPTGTATLGGQPIPVTQGFFKVNFNLTTGDYSFIIPDVGIVGPAANGWPDGANPTPDILMNTSDGDVYTLTGQVLNDGPLKFRQDLDWSVNWGGDTFPDGTFTGNDINVTAGTYDITFSRSAGTYSFATLSVADISFTSFKLHPNPTTDVWFFENPNQNIKQISVYNTLGKLVHDTKIEASVGEIDGRIFSKGIYLAKIELNNGEQTTVKIIKQ